MKISTVLDQIDLGSMALPEFQRGYVWNRDQVRKLMYSLYHDFPVGSLLVWITKTESAQTRGDTPLPPGTVDLILDGQQRMTSLYGIIRGESPKFFEGNAQVFSGLYFNLEDEVFEFYMPAKMKGNPLWISVTDLMNRGIGEYIEGFLGNPEFESRRNVYFKRLNRIEQIKETDIHVEKVTGEDKTVDRVVEIFNLVNSGGTKLSKGDLALAKICAKWPDARNELKERLNKWRSNGYHFRMELFLRVINSILTGEAMFSALAGVEMDQFREALSKADRSIDYLLNLVASRLGLDHDRVLGSRSSLPLLSHYLVRRGGHLTDQRERDKLLYWYVHTFLWGRYAGSTESVLNRDLELVEDIEGALDRLIEELHRNRGDLRLQPVDFEGWSRGARFYPLLYMMTRMLNSRDWDSGLELRSGLLGKHSQLELHHIFPKSRLYEFGYTKSQVNALANFTFLTKETNQRIINELPVNYFVEIVDRDSSLLESHWIPIDRKLWELEKYEEFLGERRNLLAEAANNCLDALISGTTPEVEISGPVVEAVGVKHIEVGAEEEDLLFEIHDWVVEQGLSEGEILYELTDPETGEVATVLDLAWPEGLQEGFSQPVAILIDEDREVGEIANRAGFRYFTSIEPFKRYVEQEILVLEEVA